MITFYIHMTTISPRVCFAAVRVPLKEVQGEWLASSRGRQQLQDVAWHFALDRDVFGSSLQCQQAMTVLYGASSPVHFGNVLSPAQVGRDVMCTANFRIPSVCVSVTQPTQLSTCHQYASCHANPLEWFYCCHCTMHLS